MDARRALRELGGAARREAILAKGATLGGLRASVADGSVVRASYGTYALPGVERPLVVAAALRGQVSCLSACAHWGLRLLRTPDVPHVTIPCDRHVYPDRLRRLRLPGAHRDDTYFSSGLVEPVEAAIDHATWCTTPLEQLVIIDGAMNVGRIDPVFPPALSKGGPERRDWLATLATRASASVSESVAKAVLDAAGWRPRAQEAHAGAGRVDLAVGRHHVIEIDSWEYHGDKEAFSNDRRRDREITARSNWSVRYTYWDVVRDPRAFGYDVARVTGLRLSKLYERRVRWMTTMPAGHLNRRTD